VIPEAEHMALPLVEEYAHRDTDTEYDLPADIRQLGVDTLPLQVDTLQLGVDAKT